ncbi:MAG: Asp-tRNA(Asn)/Glu-tRNA(Gln) amidotransferase subunit GatA [Patescibacteria group bacterium]
MKLDHNHLTIASAGLALRRGDYTATELVSAYWERAKLENPRLNIYREVFADALDQAASADEKLRANNDPNPLLGIPLAIKDNILIRGRSAGAASRILENYRASYDATAIDRLRRAGAVLLGRTNMDEFAMGSSTENSAYGWVRNPLDPERVAGGSSGGSAAAVAAGVALAALGSDTGGSIRQPASFCGVIGLKTTYGAVSRSGLMALGSSLDQIGPLGRTVDCVASLYGAIAGCDPLDSTSQDYPPPRPLPQKIKVGVPHAFLESGLDPAVAAQFEQALAKLRDANADIVTVDLPHWRQALAVYYIIMPAEASTNLARYDGVRYGYYQAGEDLVDDYAVTRGAGFGSEPRRRIMIGTYVLSAGYYEAYYAKAVGVRAAITAETKRVLEEVDFIATPTTTGPAFRPGERSTDPVAMYLEDIFTVPANLAGVPAISLPMGRVNNLPLGLQLIAPAGAEEWLFTIGRRLGY